VEYKPSFFRAQVHGLASSTEHNDEMGHIVGASQTVRPAPNPRTNWTRRVPRPVLIGHAASVSNSRAATMCALWP